MAEGTVVAGVDVEKLESFRAGLEREQVWLGLEARALWEGIELETIKRLAEHSPVHGLLSFPNEIATTVHAAERG